MSCGNALTVKPLLDAEQISSFYENWEESAVQRNWPHLQRKEIRVETKSGEFVSLNRLKSRLNFRSLKQLCTRIPPVHVYMSVLNWLKPERVGTKAESRRAYPVGGEYVLDLDHYLRYVSHGHRTEPEGFCYGCLGSIKELTVRAIDAVLKNYCDVRVVFSGKRGFHIHVLDFEVRDWTRYEEHDPLRSHEVSRFLYSLELQKQVSDLFDESHFILSSDVTQVISYPESLNGESGLVCSYLGKPKEFNRMNVEDIIKKARQQKHVKEAMNWTIAADWKNPRYNLLSP